MMRIHNQRGVPLVFHCQHDLNQLRWYCQNIDGSLDSGGPDTPLPSAAFSKIILMVPASQVLFTHVHSEHIHRQTLSWQFEEIALDEPETLHTIILSDEAEQTHLAAINKPWLQSALEAIKKLGVEVTQVLPDVLAVAPGIGICIDRLWLIRSSEWSGISANAEDLPLVQQLDPTLATITFCPQSGIDRLIAGAIQSQVNFLQGDFTRKLSLRTPRRLLIAGCLCCIISVLLPPLIAGWQAGRTLNALQRQTQQIYATYFPQQTPIDPERQFSKAYHDLLTATVPDSMLLLLADNAAMLATLQDNPLQSLIWDERKQQLRLNFVQEIVMNPPRSPGMRFAVVDKEMIISRDTTQK